MVRSSKGRPNTRLWRDQRLTAGSPRISSPAPNGWLCTRDVTLTTTSKRRVKMKIVNFAARRIPGMAHYCSARAFAVNPARLKARPLRARGLTAQRGQATAPPCQEWNRVGLPTEGLSKWIDERLAKFALDKESPIQGQKPQPSGFRTGDGILCLGDVRGDLSPNGDRRLWTCSYLFHGGEIGLFLVPEFPKKILCVQCLMPHLLTFRPSMPPKT